MVVGTRPEAIKMAPVILELQRRRDEVASLVLSTGQHREILAHTLGVFGIEVDHELALMRAGQSLPALTGRAVEAVGGYLEQHRPDWVLVQGDTVTAMAAGLAAFQLGMRVGHVEAGLRSGNLRSPFPEEANRRILSAFCDAHFAPTPRARDALIAEGRSADSVYLTGNTVIDALQFARRSLDARGDRPAVLDSAAALGERLVLVTSHRRENLDQGIANMCRAIAKTASTHADVVFVFPVHPNPAVRERVYGLLSNLPNVILCEPLDYASFVPVLVAADLVLTDSGGVQEEASALGKPILIVRTETERMEAVEAGNAMLVGIEESRIVDALAVLLDDGEKRKSMSVPSNVFGDGNAAQRIADVVLRA